MVSFSVTLVARVPRFAFGLQGLRFRAVSLGLSGRELESLGPD